MIPIGQGQQELIIGDRKTGKTAVGLTPSSTRSGTGAPTTPWSASTLPWVKKNPPWPPWWKTSRKPVRWTTPCGLGFSISRHRCSTSRCMPVVRWPSTSCGKAKKASCPSTRWWCTTTCPSKPWRIASSPCYFVVLQVVKPIPVTCSICTAGCSNGDQAFGRERRRFVDALPVIETKKVTCPPTSPPT